MKTATATKRAEVLPLRTRAARRADAGQDYHYRLDVRHPAGGEPRVSVRDTRRDCITLDWRGATAAALLNGDSPVGPLGDGRLLGKAEVQAIAMFAVALRFRGRLGETEQRRLNAEAALRKRQAALARTLSPRHLPVACLLFEYPGEHLSEGDVLSLCAMRHPALYGHRVQGILDELVGSRFLQAIDAGGIRFYDIDTRPHLHIYCAERQELHDAPEQGIIEAAALRRPV